MLLTCVLIIRYFVVTEFVDCSLAQTKKISGTEGYSFVVHDLIIDYLRDTTSEEATRGYHQGLVKKYRAQCNGDFTMVTADGYIHHQLLYHLEQAGEHETRTSLLSNLRWLRACIWHCSSSVVLSWYIKECIGEVCACVCVHVCLCVHVCMYVCMYLLVYYVYTSTCVCICRVILSIQSTIIIRAH